MKTDYSIGDWRLVIYNENVWPGISIVNDAQIFSIIFLLLVDFNRFRYSSKKGSTIKYEAILMKSLSPPHPVTAGGDLIIKKL